MKSHRKLCLECGIPERKVYRYKKKLGLSFADTLQLLKTNKKPSNKRIDGLDVNEYCEKYNYKYKKEFYRHWHILMEGV